MPSINVSVACKCGYLQTSETVDFRASIYSSWLGLLWGHIKVQYYKYLYIGANVFHYTTVRPNIVPCSMFISPNNRCV